MTKQVLVFGAAVMTTLLSLVVFWQFRIVFIYIMVSLALAATVRPWIVDLKRRRLVMRSVLVLLYVVGVAGIGFLILLFGRYALNDIQQLAQTLSVQGSWKMPPWLEGSSFQNLLVTWLPTPDTLFEAITGEEGQFVLPAMLNFTEGIGTFVSGAFLILFLSIYWSINQIHFERLWLSLLTSEQRKHARGIWRSIEPDLGAYIRSELVQSVLAVFLLSIGYWLLGSPYPALLALLGALAWLVPVVGVVLALLPPLSIGMLTSVPLSFFMAIYTLVIILALQLWIEPRLFKRNWDNPIVTLIIMLAMADAFGLLGIMVAPPLSAVCQIVWNLSAGDRLASGATVHIMDLNERQEHLRTVIAEMEVAPPPLVVNSMDRLAALLKKAQPILPVTSPIEASESKLPLP